MVKFWQKRACNYANPFMRENTRGYRRKTVNLHVELVSDARFVDLTNHWARGTLKTYQSKYRVIRDFGTNLDIPMLQPTALVRPPHGKAIKLMWAQERYSLYPLEWRQRNSPLAESVKFGSIQGVRSVASHFWIWDLLLTHPERLTFGYKDRPTLVEGCSPTEEISYTCFTDGMRPRIGDNPRPWAVLLLEHILWIDRFYSREFAAAITDDARIEACRAAICHATSYGRMSCVWNPSGAQRWVSQRVLVSSSRSFFLK
jgi:hypothetical protein